MTAGEFRAGLLRLAVVLVAILLGVLSLAAVLYAAGEASFRVALASGFGVASLLPLVGGIAAYLGSGPIRREGSALRGQSLLRRAGEDERREREHLAAGLLALGSALFLCAMVVG
jgi:hypothetical protein